MNIITEKITFGGKSLAKNEGKAIFVPYGIPGEELEVEIIESKRDFDNAEIKKIIKASEHRVEPQCKYYYKCGGCNMMHIEPSYQRELRKQILIDIFEQNGINVKDKVSIIYDKDTHYRSRFQFTNGGLNQKNSNEIIPIQECLCAEKPVNDFLLETSIENRPKGRCHVFGSDFLINEEKKIKVAQIQEQKISKNIGNKNKKIKIKENHYFSGTVADPKNSLTVQINGKNLCFDVRGFFQSNLFFFQKVLNLILDTLGTGQNVLDMYAGCGSISTFLAEKFQHVTLVEHNRDALVFAEQNMAGAKHTSYGLSGEAFVKNCVSACPKFDACVVDPPRSGMEKAVLDYLCKSEIPQIRSLSCDPATHARDCAQLVKAGYNLEALYLLDFYPNTSHIESLAIFTK